MKTITKKVGDLTIREIHRECGKHDYCKEECPLCTAICWPLRSPHAIKLNTKITLEVEE